MTTLEELQAATDEELRVKLLGLTGWSNISQDGRFGYREGLCGESGRTSTPDYPQDLNACFEVVDTKLDGTQYAAFAKNLGIAHPTFCISVLDNRDELEDGLWQMASLINADGRLRTIALILTLQ